MKEHWCIPPEANAEFGWHMAEGLDGYTRPYDPTRPLIGLDATSRQLLGDAHAPLPAVPEQPARMPSRQTGPASAAGS